MENELKNNANNEEANMMNELVQQPEDMISARDNLKLHIKEFLEENTIYNLMPSNGELPIVDWETSISDLVRILEHEDKMYCLLWNSAMQRIEGIHVTVDLINFVLNLDLKLFSHSKKDHTQTDRDTGLVEVTKQIQKCFTDISIRKVRDNLKTFKGLSTQTLVYMKYTDTIFNGIQKMRETSVGHLVITETDSISSSIGILSKKDILVYMIKNFTTDSKIDILLNEKIGNLQLGTTGSQVFYAGKQDTLRRVFQEMNRLKLSCIPIIDESGLYLGAIIKGHLETLLRNACLYFLDWKVGDFLDHIKNNEHESMAVTIVYPSDSLRDVVQKFIMTKGQNIYLDANNKLQGVITINDVINYLL